MHASILHISDLHRDPHNPIRNDVLLNSLDNDQRHYAAEESPAVRPPDIIVISGDVVQGVKAEEADAEKKLAAQYDEALDCLGRLADRFVAGDRSRVIIVPGNHDVSAYHFKNSLRKVELTDAREKELAAELFTANSRFRWSWQTFELFEIVDDALYEQRMAAFAQFYERFYAGTRSFSIDPDEQVDIFDFPGLDVVFAGFSSCYNNDLYNRMASIHPACIARATNMLRRRAYSTRIRVGVWHHSTEGAPGHADYLDPDVLQNLIDGGFSLGFHGHQHRPQFIDTRFKTTSVVRSEVDEVISGVGAVYRMSDAWTLLGGIHNGFNPPGPGANSEAEESLNYEAGARYAREAASAELIAFYNDYDNLVGTCTASTGGGCNLGDQFAGGKVRMQGLELSGRYELGLERGLRLPVQLAYTYTSAEFRTSFASGFEEWGNVAVGDELPYLPEHQAQLLIGLVAERWGVNLAASYTGAMRVEAGQGATSPTGATDGHWVMDLVADWTLTDNLRLLARVENVLDEVYVAAWRPAGARPGRPRTALIGINASF